MNPSYQWWAHVLRLLRVWKLENCCHEFIGNKDRMTWCFPSIGTIAGEGGSATKPPRSQLWSMCTGVILYRFRYVNQFVQKNIFCSYQMCIHMTLPLHEQIVEACQYGFFSVLFEHQNHHIHWFIHLGTHKCWTNPSLPGPEAGLVKLSPGHPPLPKRRFPQLATLAWPDETLKKIPETVVFLTLLNVMKEQHANWEPIDFWSYNQLFLPKVSRNNIKVMRSRVNECV